MYSGTEAHWLQGYPALENLDDPAWRVALQKFEIMDVPTETTVFRPGDPCSYLLFLVKGDVRVYMSGDNGREIVLSHLKGGDLCILTLTTLLQTSDYSASAVTETPICAARLPVADFRKAFASSMGFQDFILSTLARRMHDTLFLLQEVAFERLEMRLACFLLRQRNGYDNCAVEMTHQQIACELGTTREMISRILKDLERRGCVRLSRKRVELADTSRLENINHGPTRNI
ncbi:hypothetical protein MNBD_GAMMA14-207 [hydrothermal vent metagenome]|uniref:Transcriptional regulator, Crp/Fnr family n=1 Tax=hydrothermal vent metagenome TaxID=652676 RepID=A0A3B0YEZ9_9ZZZZ